MSLACGRRWWSLATRTWAKPVSPGASYFRRRAETAFNLALVARGGSIWISNLALRDYLRTNPEAAREYAEIKRSAFRSGIRSLLAYSDYKSAVVTALIGRALQPR